MARSTSKAEPGKAKKGGMPAFTFAWVAIGLMLVAAILAFAKQDVAAICLVGVAGVMLIVMCVVEVRAFHTQQHDKGDFFTNPPAGEHHLSSQTHLPMGRNK
jgi:fatty acid desaturase